VVHAHTEERDPKSVFHRRMSLKPVQRDYRVYIHRGGVTMSQQAAALQVRRSQRESEVSNESLRVTTSQYESEGSQAGSGPAIAILGRKGGRRKTKGDES